MNNQEKAEQAMRDLLECSNVMGSDVDVSKAISNVLSREHRTLQQAFMRSFVNAMDTYKDSGSDLRNEGSIQLATEIANTKIGLPYV